MLSAARTAVLTLVHRRSEQLLAQVGGLSLGSQPPHLHVVIAMSDQEVSRGRLPITTDRWRTIVRAIPTDPRRLPLAAARNLAASLAIEEEVDNLVFLDVDCIPGRRTLQTYVAALAGQLDPESTTDQPTAWVGDVAYLPPAGDLGYRLDTLDQDARVRSDRPLLPPGVVEDVGPEMFGAESFAMSVADFQASGGFHEEYLGPGLEDHDFAMGLIRSGGAVRRVGGATVYHQHHAPALEAGHPAAVRAYVRNAEVFHDRWQEWPTALAGLREAGMAEQDAEGRWVAAS